MHFLNVRIKNQQTEENVGCAGQGVQMLCGTTQSGTSGHPNYTS